VSDFSAGWVGIYSIDDGKLINSVSVGKGPDALAFSADGHLLLVLNAQSGDIAVVRTGITPAASLLTLFPAGRAPNDIVVKAFRVH